MDEYTPRGDASKINGPAAPVSMTKEDMRYLYRQLQTEVSNLVDDEHPEVLKLVQSEATRAFEMARHAVKIDGKVITDGQEFKSSCETTIGVEPLNEELQREITALHGDINNELSELMSLRRRLPQRMRRKLANPAPKPPQIKVRVEAPQLDRELINNAKGSLAKLETLEKRSESLKKKKSALEFTR